MKIALAILLSCFALLTSAIWHNETECKNTDGRNCPQSPGAASCSRGRCFMSSAVGSVSQIYGIEQDLIVSPLAKWTMYDRSDIVPQSLSHVHASEFSNAVFAAGLHHADEALDSVIYSSDPANSDFSHVAGTFGPIVHLAALPGTVGYVGAVYVRKVSGVYESGVHVISPNGVLTETKEFSNILPFVPNDFSFSSAYTWFATAALTDKDSVVIRTDDSGATWTTVHALYGSKSLLQRIQCNRVMCSALAFGGEETTLFMGDIEPTIQWNAVIAPTGLRRFLARRFTMNKNGSRLMIAGILPDSLAHDKGRAFYVKRSPSAPAKFNDVGHPYVEAYDGATFITDTLGLILGYGSEVSVYTLVED